MNSSWSKVYGRPAKTFSQRRCTRLHPLDLPSDNSSALDIFWLVVRLEAESVIWRVNNEAGPGWKAAALPKVRMVAIAMHFIMVKSHNDKT